MTLSNRPQAATIRDIIFQSLDKGLSKNKIQKELISKNLGYTRSELLKDIDNLKIERKAIVEGPDRRQAPRPQETPVSRQATGDTAADLEKSRKKSVNATPKGNKPGQLYKTNDLGEKKKPVKQQKEKPAQEKQERPRPVYNPKVSRGKKGPKISFPEKHPRPGKPEERKILSEGEKLDRGVQRFIKHIKPVTQQKREEPPKSLKARQIEAQKRTPEEIKQIKPDSKKSDYTFNFYDKKGHTIEKNVRKYQILKQLMDSKGAGAKSSEYINALKKEGLSYNKSNMYLDFRRAKAIEHARSPEGKERANEWFNKVYEKVRTYLKNEGKPYNRAAVNKYIQEWKKSTDKITADADKRISDFYAAMNLTEGSP